MIFLCLYNLFHTFSLISSLLFLGCYYWTSFFIKTYNMTGWWNFYPQLYPKKRMLLTYSDDISIWYIILQEEELVIFICRHSLFYMFSPISTLLFHACYYCTSFFIKTCNIRRRWWNFYPLLYPEKALSLNYPDDISIWYIILQKDKLMIFIYLYNLFYIFSPISTLLFHACYYCTRFFIKLIRRWRNF